MKAISLAAAAAALSLTAGIALAQEPGFGGHDNVSKNQVPGPGVENPSDPAAGNPGSAAQIPTAPQKKKDLYDSGAASGAASGETGAPTQKPATSDPSPSR